MLKEILESRSLELPNDYQDWSGFLSELESSLIVHLGSIESAYCLHGRVAQWLFDSLKPVADPGLRTPLNSLSWVAVASGAGTWLRGSSKREGKGLSLKVLPAYLNRHFMRRTGVKEKLNFVLFFFSFLYEK